MKQSGADIGVIGLAVMGENLVLNMASRGYTVAVYNRTTSKVDAFLAGSRGRQDHRRRVVAGGARLQARESPGE